MADATQLRFAQALKRVFAIKTADPGRTLSPIISPSFDVQDAYQPENRLLRGERSFAGGFQLTNTNAVNFGAIQLVSPAGSGKLLVVKRVTVDLSIPTATIQPGNLLFFMQFAPFTVAAQTVLTYKDTRLSSPLGGFSTTTAAFQQSTTGIVGITILQTALTGIQLFPGAAAAPFVQAFDNLDIVLFPADVLPSSRNVALSIQVASNVLPTATYTWNVFVEGYERVIDPSETIVPP